MYYIYVYKNTKINIFQKNAVWSVDYFMTKEGYNISFDSDKSFATQ